MVNEKKFKETIKDMASEFDKQYAVLLEQKEEPKRETRVKSIHELTDKEYEEKYANFMGGMYD